MEDQTAGAAFAEALAAKDHDRLREILAPELDFRALTPRRNWEATTPDQAIAEVFTVWFDGEDRIEDLERVETDVVAARERVGYRLAVTNPEGNFLVEQQAYLGTDADGRIDWLRILCAGFQPVD